MISTTTGEWERGLGESTAAYEDGLAVGDEPVTVEGILGVGYCHLHGGRMDEARTALDEAIERSAGGVSDFLHSLALTLKGMLLFATGDARGRHGARRAGAPDPGSRRTTTSWAASRSASSRR